MRRVRGRGVQSELRPLRSRRREGPVGRPYSLRAPNGVGGGSPRCSSFPVGSSVTVRGLGPSTQTHGRLSSPQVLESKVRPRPPSYLKGRRGEELGFRSSGRDSKTLRSLPSLVLGPSLNVRPPNESRLWTPTSLPPSPDQRPRPYAVHFRPWSPRLLPPMFPRLSTGDQFPKTPHRSGP